MSNLAHNMEHITAWNKCIFLDELSKYKKSAVGSIILTIGEVNIGHNT